ncbi:MAG: hypothetical protein AABP62_31420 [Planctomycetota bacterium]
MILVRDRLGTFTTIVFELLACVCSAPALLQAQAPVIPSEYASSLEQPVRREVARVRSAMARDEVAFIEWPPELVGAAKLTAIDLKTGQWKWTCSVEPASGATLAIAGDYILHRSFANNAYVERLIHRATGELDVLPLGDGQSAVPQDQRAWHGGMPVHGDWLVTDQIIRLGDKHVVRDLDFSWDVAMSHRGKLFTHGHRDRRMTNEYVLRRTDLETGRDDMEVPFAELLASEGMLGYVDIVAVSGDVVAISTSWQATPNGPTVRGYKAFNLVNRREIWRAEVETRFGHVAVQFHHPDGLGLRNPIANWNPLRQRPLLIDLATGRMEPDPEWRDPYSLLSWHTGGFPIDFTARNEHYAVALLSKTSLICVDLETGLLVWKHDVGTDRVWPAITSTEDLGEYVMVPHPGSVDVFEISTGQRRVIKPADVGLTAIVQPPLPAGGSIPVGTGGIARAKHDWWIDGLIQSLVALPLVAWGVYLLIRRRFPKRLSTGNDSPK